MRNVSRLQYLVHSPQVFTRGIYLRLIEAIKSIIVGLRKRRKNQKKSQARVVDSLTYLPKVTEEKQTGSATYWRQMVMHSVSRPKWIKVNNLRGIVGKVPMSLRTCKKFCSTAQEGWC